MEESITRGSESCNTVGQFLLCNHCNLSTITLQPIYMTQKNITSRWHLLFIALLLPAIFIEIIIRTHCLRLYNWLNLGVIILINEKVVYNENRRNEICRSLDVFFSRLERTIKQPKPSFQNSKGAL